MIVQVLVFGLLQGERSRGTRLEMLAFFQEGGVYLLGREHILQGR